MSACVCLCVCFLPFSLWFSHPDRDSLFSFFLFFLFLLSACSRACSVLPLLWSGFCSHKALNLTLFSPELPPGDHVQCHDYCHNAVSSSSLTLMGIVFLSLVYICMQLARYQWDAVKWSRHRRQEKLKRGL